MESSPTILEFTVDSPSNTSLTNANGEVLYSVKTEHSEEIVTYIRNGNEQVIASSKWRDVLPDKITIGDRAPISLNDWLHHSIIPFIE